MQTRTRIYSSPVEGRADTRAAPRMIALRQTNRTEKPTKNPRFIIFSRRAPPLFFCFLMSVCLLAEGEEEKIWDGGCGGRARQYAEVRRGRPASWLPCAGAHDTPPRGWWREPSQADKPSWPRQGRSARIGGKKRTHHLPTENVPCQCHSLTHVSGSGSGSVFLCVAARSPPRPNVSQPGWNCLIRLTRLDTYEGYKQCALLWLCKCGGGSHELLHDHKNSDAKRWIDYYRQALSLRRRGK